MSKRARDMAVRHLNKGVSLIEKGNYEDAQHALSEAEMHAKESNSPEILASVLQTYADLLYSNGLENEALERYYQALDTISENGVPSYMDKGQLAGMFSNMASILELKGNMEEAKDKYKRSIAGYEEIILKKESSNKKDMANAVSTLNNFGAFLAELGENEDAKKNFDKALLIMDKLEVNDNSDNDSTFDKVTVLENLLNAQDSENDLEGTKDKYEELANIYRAMISDDPADQYYKQRLASTLGTYAKLLLRNEEEGKAKVILEEIIDLLNALSDEDNVSLMYEMASARSSYAACLDKEGETLAAKEEMAKAVQIIMILLGPGKFDPKYIPKAEAILEDLIRLSDREADANRKIDDYDTILKLSECLITADPSNVSHKLRMAFSLNVRGMILADIGRLDEAVSDMTRAIGIVFNEFENEPSNPSYQSAVKSMITDLEIIGKENEGKEWTLKVNQLILKELQTHESTNDNLTDLEEAILFEENGNILAENGQYEDALKNLQYAEKAYERIRNSDPESAEHALKVQSILLKTGELHSQTGQIHESLDIYLKLFRMQPSQKKYRDKLESSLDRIVIDLAEEKGKFEDLIGKYAEILAVYGELIGAEPENQDYPAKVLNLKEQLANVMLDNNKPEKALDIYCELLEIEPNNSFYRSKAVRTLDKFKMDIEAKENTDEKIDYYGLLLSKYDRFIELDPANISILSAKADTLWNMAELMENSGLVESAAANYKLVGRAYSNLLELEPTNLKYQNNLALSKARLASLLTEIGEVIDAKQTYETALQMYEILLEDDENSISYQQNIAHILGNIGYLLLEEGQIEEAKPVYEKALRVYANLMDLEPENQYHLENVAATLNNLGYILENMGRKDDAEWMYEKARSLSGN
ncbi:tetratricopeptide repeat protein [Methanolobus sp. ZRKC3]|uniref:tetratricopeptide repeat protein n=1 Tax=Methanolobus sp. ZRKC3 TaxID=3125786 RepID=UPI0032442039